MNKFTLFLIILLTLLLIFFINKYHKFYNQFEQSCDCEVKLTKIGFFLMGTGKYIELVDELIKSMEIYFCPNNKIIEVNYIIFTDKINYKPILNNDKYRKFNIIQQNKLKWPNSTLLRFEIVLSQSDFLDYKSFDYLFILA